MRSYGYENSARASSVPRDYRPYQGLFIGLLIAFGVSVLANGAVGYVFFKYLEYEELERNFAAIVADSTNYLVITLMINAMIMVYAGRAVGRRTPGKEHAYGLIFASMITLISLFVFHDYGGFALLPAWFNFLGFATMYLGSYFGARSEVVEER